MSLSLLLWLLVLCHTCLLTEGGNETQPEYDSESNSIGTRILSANSRASEKLVEGDILQTRTRIPRNAKCWYNCLWRKDSSGLVQIPYTVSTQFSRSEQDKIYSAMKSFNRTCIRFVRRTDKRKQKDYISIKNRDGCFSSVGRVGGRQILSLKRTGCVSFGIIQHELIHALGFYHEHSRSDRDRYVRINWENIEPEKTHNFQKRESNNLNTPYDYSSIMHYRKTSFSQNGRNTITPIPDASVQIGQRRDMSELDIRKINLLYRCSSQTSNQVDRVNEARF
ncbi:hatching enzyme 1.2-like [Trachinotus anak]|uniref:hatching enzyme 1.2-like n=1 Tax=Trachinotus anak TaxID=443729 RepID=UPI0039F1CE96